MNGTNSSQSHTTSEVSVNAVAQTSTSVASAGHSDQSDRKSTWLNGLLTKSSTLSSLKSWRSKTPNEAPVEAPKKDKGPLGLSTLYEPPDEIVVAEMIFIHGLGGSSIKTWSDSSGPTNCWPRDWLPVDPDFKHVRIHTYGYEADWRQRTPSILSVHDFAESLLGELRNHQLIKKSKASIVLVGHSMGGCVAKKTYILARQDSSCADLAGRFHSMFFLATPHRGSELGKVLKNLLLVTGVSKPYVKDLVANSGPVLEVNETFRQFASDLRLWSFFESLPMSDYADILVVDKHSATLGLDNEEVSFMDADHRRICKFKYQSDHNYRKLRNALSSAIDKIKETSSAVIAKSQLGSYLGVDDTFKDDFDMLREMQHPGTCAWVTEGTSFYDWTLRPPGSSPLYWLVGMPGAGKSIISSHVVDYLQNRSMTCSYFIIKREKTSSNGLTLLLMSLAFQMALQDPKIGKALLQLQEQNIYWENQNDRYIWRKLFQETIFMVESLSSHFWVIDGVDEYGRPSDMLQILEQIPQDLRVFFTSRNTSEIERGIISMGQRVHVRPFTPDDTVSDMRLFVEAELARLSHLDISDLSSRIVSKSSGSFIWTRLVLKELEMAFTDEDVEAILDEVPNDLYEMYARILKSIETQKRRAKLAKSILAWIIVAVRPMTIEELRTAVHLDLNVSPQKMDQVIAATCGQLVTVDLNYRVHLIHDTARQFLVSQDLNSELAVRPTRSHGRLAMLCLSYLNENLKAQSDIANSELSFFRYAAEYFSQHLNRSDLEDSVPFKAVCQFLENRVLYWIETLSKRQKLEIAVRTAIDLQHYADSVKIKNLFSEKDIKQIIEWATDISRIVLTFRMPLLQSPSSIHQLIPQFCPEDSCIAKSVPLREAGFTVSSPRGLDWDSCLMCIEHDVFVETVVCGQNHFAIGLSTGIVYIYDLKLLHNIMEIKCKPVQRNRIGFRNDDKYFATTGSGEIIIWEVETGKRLQQFQGDRILSFIFDDDYLITVSSSGLIETRNIPTRDLSSENWATFDNEIEEEPAIPSSGASLATFSQAHSHHLALCFWGSGDIYLLDVQRSAVVGLFQEPSMISVTALSFNPHPDRQLLAVSYHDGSLAIFDVGSMSRAYTKLDVFATQLAWATGGDNLLVGTGETAYTIEIYNLTSPTDIDLKLVGQVDHPGTPVTPFTLASHGQRIISAHSRQTRVWEFPILGQLQTASPSSSEELESNQLGGENSVISDARKGNITTMSLSADGVTIICGTESGAVVAYSAVYGSQISVLHSQHDCKISQLKLGEQHDIDWVITGDEDGFVVVAKAIHEKHRWSATETTLERRAGIFLEDILINPSQNRLLVISLSTSELWALPSGELLKTLKVPKSSARLRKVEQHPLLSDRFIIFEDSSIFYFYWDDFEPCAENPPVLYRYGRLPEPENITNASYLGNQNVFLEKLACPLTGVRVNCWDIKSFGAEATEPVIIPRRGVHGLNHVLGDIIGIIGSVLVFLNRDRWVCTADLDTLCLTLEVKRHFFIFPEWVSLFGEVLCVMTSANDLVFANKTEMTVIKSWLDTWETVWLEHFDMDAEFEEYEKNDIWVSKRALR